MNASILLRHLEGEADIKALESLFDRIFDPEPVGSFATSITRHLPGMKEDNWFIAQDTEKNKIAAAFALIPWTLQYDNIKLKTAEMGIVGTGENYRGRHLQYLLNQRFDKILKEKHFDLAIIQGIPAFYDRFGYHYAVPLENHINLQFDSIPECEDENEESYRFHPATHEDIPFLLQEDRKYRKKHDLAAIRKTSHWKYLLTDSKNTCYGSDFWIGVNKAEPKDRFYSRNPNRGFGEGLIISEVSSGINISQAHSLFRFLKDKAIEKNKPYIRLNLHTDSAAVKAAIKLGAIKGGGYAWQIKVPDPAALLIKLKPVLESRLEQSCQYSFSKIWRLNFFNSCLDLHWNQGKLKSIKRDDWKGAKNPVTFNMNRKHFSPILLGHRTWNEIAHISPDIFPEGNEASELLEILFPKMRSWIHQQY